MNEEGHDFDRLRKALALKRHETPPPRYFNELPGRILSRLAEPEPQASFWTRVGQLFSDRSMFATGAGVAAGCALLVGVGILVQKETNPVATTAAIPTATDNAVATTQGSGPVVPASFSISNANQAAELFQGNQPQAVPASLNSDAPPEAVPATMKSQPR